MSRDMKPKHIYLSILAIGLFWLIAGLIWVDYFVICIGACITLASCVMLWKDKGQRKLKKY